jgi:peptidoglycan/xylan/chitin deacetylase (PgdA/CDA1 family)
MSAAGNANQFRRESPRPGGLIANPVPWPNGARCALAITFDVDTDSLIHIAHRERAIDYLASISWLKYDEVAVPRILAMYKRLGLKQTFFYPAWCMERYPHLVDAILVDGHEIAAHGYLHEAANTMPLDRQIYWLDKQSDVIKRMTGKYPRGWRGPLYSASRHTPTLLAQRGFLYDSTLMGDDVPYVLNTPAGELMVLSTHHAMDDWAHFTHAHEFDYVMPIRSPDEAFAVYDAELRAARNQGGLVITVWHPFVTGRLSRFERMERWLEEILDAGDVWVASLEDIAAHARACEASGSWTPRRNAYPYYDSPVPELELEPAR